MQAIPFLDLKSQYNAIKTEVDEAALAALASTAYVLGPEVANFEQEFAAHQGTKHGIAVNTGTSALHVALLAAGVGAGDEVITVSMTFIATAAAITYTGATPVFVDVDPKTFTMDPSKIEAKITPRTKAILPVHLYGQSADMAAIMDIATRHGLMVIEDAAQAHGAEFQGKRVGGIGHISAFSFYPGKNLGAYGEGGIALTNDPDFAHKMKLLRDWGQTKKYHHDMLAFNYRMDGIQGAILRVKLRHLEAWTELRRARALQYQQLLANVQIRHCLEMPGRRHVYHIFSVFHPERHKLQAALLDAGIQSGLHYPIPVHLQKPYESLGYRAGDLPVTERTAREQLSLPMFAELTELQVERVVDSVRGFVEIYTPVSAES